MDARSEPTPFDQRLFLIFIVTFATMTVFEFAGQYLYPYPPDWRSNLITSLFTSGLAVIIAYFPLKAYYDMNTQLLSEVARRHGVEMELREQKERLKKTNKKLTMLSTITRHDIKNTLTGLVGFLQLVKNEAPDDPHLQEHLNKLMECSETIEQQIEFTQYYEELGTGNAGWYNVQKGVLDEARQLSLDGITLDPGPSGLSIYADPLISKVYYNLIENAIRHGGHVTAISFAAAESDNGLVISCSDNGNGIPPSEKEAIFLRGHGGNTGLGLFLIREILAITGISIKETGTFGTGARFEILVPKGGYLLKAG